MTPSLLCPPLGCAKENLKSQGNITIEPLPPQKQFSSRLCWMMVEPGSSLSQTMAQSAPLTAGNTLFSVASYIHLCCNTDIHCTTHTHTHTHTHTNKHTHIHTHTNTQTHTHTQTNTHTYTHTHTHTHSSRLLRLSSPWLEGWVDHLDNYK